MLRFATPGRRPDRTARRLGLAAALGFAALTALLTAPARADLPIESEPILYLTAPVHDPVAKLQEKLDKGEAKLPYDEKQGYLKAVLDQLKIPVSSQMLVFSKTSFQRTKISPHAPRAIYFNDNVYIGYVQDGDVLEASTVDPQQGAVFYLLDQRKSDKPVFLRQTHDCLQCHASSKTQDVPGHLVRSVYPDETGIPVFNAGTFTTDHTSPLKERWGGWYVTGKHGSQRHMGNVLVNDKDHPDQLETAAGANVTELSGRLDTAPYLAPHSDIVALMVLEHQTQMHNLITAANYQTRIAIHHEKAINEALGRPADALSSRTLQRLKRPAEALVKYMLFVGETKLTDPIEGTSPFTHDFAARGPCDRQGRSLRDFDLQRRLFKYPCSYLIYSEAFEALPPQIKEHVYRRLWEVLTGKDTSAEFAHLSAEHRKAIFEILRETKEGLPGYWK